MVYKNQIESLQPCNDPADRVAAIDCDCTCWQLYKKQVYSNLQAHTVRSFLIGLKWLLSEGTRHVMLQWRDVAISYTGGAPDLSTAALTSSCLAGSLDGAQSRASSARLPPPHLPSQLRPPT